MFKIGVYRVGLVIISLKMIILFLINVQNCGYIFYCMLNVRKKTNLTGLLYKMNV